ncbi:hypothetical protein F5Y17DRAFT_461042 [Xylariaceae sp. FL0594]|nr:hypothetical protein F5Y17DRAFT_461042 [Xylariaceae sp. FL0594]
MVYGSNFIFPCANGGSLEDFYKTIEKQEPTEDLVRQIITQLRASADGLDHLHRFEPVAGNDLLDGEMREARIKLDRRPVSFGYDSLRHGDLKPENLLRFLDNDEISTSATIVGTLKLADMGLAKRSHVGTKLRTSPTNTKRASVHPVL